jgi:predicted alpha/beta superfamily hydrolase
MFLNLCTVGAALCMAFSLHTENAEATTNTKQKSEDITIGKRLSIQSKILNEPREIVISIPRSYEQNTDQKYPVLYVLDGGSHFYMATGIVDWLSAGANQIPELIVVGILNTNIPTGRARDFTATTLPNGIGGGAQHFRRFISEELMPYVDDNFRTQPFSIISGHSMAGLFTLDSLISDHQIFKGYISTSPYLIANPNENGTLARASKALKSAKDLPVTFYTSIGSYENTLTASHTALTKALKTSGAKNLAWRSDILGNQEHMSTPGISLYKGLQFIFSDLTLAPGSVVSQKGTDAIRDHFEKISSEKYGYKISAETAINALAVSYQQGGDTPKAIEIFTESAELYPASWQTHVSLMQAYASIQEYENALSAAKAAQQIAKAQQHPIADALGGQIQQLEALIKRTP